MDALPGSDGEVGLQDPLQAFGPHAQAQENLVHLWAEGSGESMVIRSDEVHGNSGPTA